MTLSVDNPVFCALDTAERGRALALARSVKDTVGGLKIGMEAFYALGRDGYEAIAAEGLPVFLDLKLHDIPTTVERSARVLGALGVSYLTLHAHGGVEMMRAGVRGLAEGATNAGLEVPSSLAITVLTSDDEAPPHIMPKRVGLAAEAGCSGIVCAVSDLTEAHHYAPRLQRVVAGIRLPGDPVDDQRRVASPAEALNGGADLLVVGRSVTRADDPIAAATRLHEVASAVD